MFPLCVELRDKLQSLPATDLKQKWIIHKFKIQNSKGQKINLWACENVTFSVKIASKICYTINRHYSILLYSTVIRTLYQRLKKLKLDNLRKRNDSATICQQQEFIAFVCFVPHVRPIQLITKTERCYIRRFEKCFQKRRLRELQVRRRRRRHRRSRQKY